MFEVPFEGPDQRLVDILIEEEAKGKEREEIRQFAAEII